MKKILALIVFTLILSGSIYSQSSWEKKIVDSTMNFFQVQFVNSQTGYICGDNISVSYNSCIYKTTNSGINWFKVTQNSQNNYGIFFINATTGFVSLYYPGFPGYGELARTTNSGATWLTVKTLYGGGFANLYFYNDMIGFYSGYQEFSKTTNGGNVWTTYPRPSLWIAQMQLLNQNNGYYLGIDNLGYRNSVFRTTNGGINWSQIYISYYYLEDMTFSDLLNGYLVGKQTNGTLFKTTNGGYNWISNFTTFEGLKKVKFPTFYVGYVLGDSSRIFRTSNAGDNWSTQNLDSAYRYNDLSFANEYTGFVVGQRGIIMRTTNGGSTFINPITETPSMYSLYQNYPNPFNPITNVKFSIVSSPHGLGGDLVQLKVYDIQGREVQTLVNERLQPGTYEAAFDASSLNSGVYFYKLITNGFTETKKMLLIK